MTQKPVIKMSVYALNTHNGYVVKDILCDIKTVSTF